MFLAGQREWWSACLGSVAYGRGLLVGMPQSVTSLVAAHDQPPEGALGLGWSRTERKGDCLPGTCVKSKRVI